jgi:hypothetical protein
MKNDYEFMGLTPKLLIEQTTVRTKELPMRLFLPLNSVVVTKNMWLFYQLKFASFQI